MSERAPHKSHEALSSPEKHELLVAKLPEAGKHEKEPKQAAHEARKAIAETTRANKHPDPLERLQDAEEQPKTTPQHINQELKQLTLQRELQHIRRKLPAPQRALSKVIHQPAVRAVSEAAGQTVSRPSGLLGGGLVALLGTSTYLYLAHHIGFAYNYGVFLVLFVAGFGIGLLLELAVYLATANRRKADH